MFLGDDTTTTAAAATTTETLGPLATLTTAKKRMLKWGRSNGVNSSFVANTTNLDNEVTL